MDHGFSAVCDEEPSEELGNEGGLGGGGLGMPGYNR